MVDIFPQNWVCLRNISFLGIIKPLTPLRLHNGINIWIILVSALLGLALLTLNEFAPAPEQWNLSYLTARYSCPLVTLSCSSGFKPNILHFPWTCDYLLKVRAYTYTYIHILLLSYFVVLLPERCRIWGALRYCVHKT